MNKKNLIIIIIFIFSLLLITTSFSQSPPPEKIGGGDSNKTPITSFGNLSIKQSKQWKVVQFKDSMYNVEVIGSRNRQESKICLIHKNPEADVPFNRDIYNKSGDKLDTKLYEFIGDNKAYCYNINTEDYVEFGLNSTIVKYDDIQLLEYNSGFSDINFALYKNSSLGFNYNISDIWASNSSDNYKFGANDTSNTGVEYYSYILESSYPIYHDEGYKYYFTKIRHENRPFRAVSENHVIDFSDICKKTDIEQSGQDAECKFGLYKHTFVDNNTYYFMNLTFYSNSDIDPTISVNTFSTSESIDTNVTQENNFTHLIISDEDPYKSGDLGLIAYYPFDVENGSNQKIYDYSKYNEDINVTGADWNENCMYGGCYFFKDTNIMTTSTTEMFTNFNGFTFSFWINTTGLPTSASFADIISTNQVEGVMLNDMGNIDIYSTSSSVCASNTALSVGQWYHVTVAGNYSDEVTGAANIYINGVNDKTCDSGFGWSSPIDTIGSNFNGTLDDIMIFNYTLNSSQVSDIYNNVSKRFKTQGTQVLKQFNITQSVGNNTVNVTTTSFSEPFGSQLELRLGEWYTALGYNDSINGDVNNTNDKLRLYYHFDNDTNYENSTNVFDWSGSNNNGTVKNGQVIDSDGVFGGSFKFDGINDYVNVSLTMNTADNFSVSVWFSSDDWVANSWDQIVDTRAADLITPIRIGALNKTIKCVIESDSPTGQLFAVDLNTNPTGWHHAACVYDTDLNRLTGYFDGLRIGEVNFTNDDVSSTYFQIGQDPTFASEEMNGSVDELMVFNRSLTNPDVKELYIKGRAKYNYLTYQDLVEGSHNVFYIDLNTTNILPEYRFTAANSTNPFYSPSLEAGMSFQFNNDIVPPGIEFVSPTPANATQTTNTTLNFNVSITDNNLDEVKWNWDGTNYTIFDKYIMLMYNFDNVSALGENDTHLFDISRTGNNGTAIGGFLANNSGKYGGSYHFDGVNDYINTTDETNPQTIGNLTFRSNRNWSVSFWYKGIQNGCGSITNPILSRDNSDLYASLGICNDLFTYSPYNGVSYIKINSSTNVSDDQWHHLVYVNHENLTGDIYVDGKQERQGKNSTMASPSLNYFTINTIMRGYSGSSMYTYGDLDDLIIMNKSLNINEVRQLYMVNLRNYDAQNWSLYVNQDENGTDVLDVGNYTYMSSAKDIAGNENLTELRSIEVQSVLISPNVTINQPLNQSYTTTTINFNVTATDNVGMSDVYYTLDNGLTNYSMNNLSTSPTQWTASNTTMSQGSHTVRYYANDTSNLINDSEEVTFFIDSINPVVTIVYPSNNTNHSTGLVNINFTATDTNLAVCSFDNDSMTDRTIIACGNNITNITWSEGTHNVTIYANDSAGNEHSGTVTFRIDTTPPTLSFTNQTIENNQSLSHDINATDTGVGVESFTQNWTNNFTIGISNGSLINTSRLLTANYTINITVNDTLGNLASSLINIEVIDPPVDYNPNVTINQPINQSYTTTTINFNVTAVDDDDMSDVYYTLDNGVTNYSMNNLSTSPTQWTASNTTMAQGSHTVTYYTNDTNNNINGSESITFFIDSINPVVTITTPSNNTNTTNTGLNVNFTVTDTNLQTCWWTNDTMTENITIACSGGLSNITNITWSEGNHNITVYANDTLNNEGHASISFTIDTTPLGIDYGAVVVANNTNTTATSIFLNATVTGSGEESVVFAIHFSNGSLVNSTLFTNQTRTINYTSLSDGIYIYNITINDTVGNRNTTVVRTLTIDTTGPSLLFTNQTIKDNQSLSHDINATDVGVEIESFIIDDTGNFTINISSGILINATKLSVFNYTVNITVNDTLGNINSNLIGIEVQNASSEAPAPPAGGGGGGGGSTASGSLLNDLLVVVKEEWNFGIKDTVLVYSLNNNNETIQVDNINIDIIENINRSEGNLNLNVDLSYEKSFTIPKQSINDFNFNITVSHKGSKINQVRKVEIDNAFTFEQIKQTFVGRSNRFGRLIEGNFLMILVASIVLLLSLIMFIVYGVYKNSKRQPIIPT